MWDPTDKFALLEDGSGNGFILRVCYRVQNGRVIEAGTHDELLQQGAAYARLYHIQFGERPDQD